MDILMVKSYLHTGWMVALPIAGSMLLAWSIVSLYFDFRSTKYRKLLERLNGSEFPKYSHAVEASILRQEPFLGFGGFGQLLNKINLFRRLQKMFVQANIFWTVPKFIFFTGTLSIPFFFVCFLFYGKMIFSLVIAASIPLLPLLIIDLKRKRRMKKLVEQLPEAFELISQSLRAGHSLNSGIQVVSSQMPDPTGTVFERVFMEQSFGLSIEDALKNMSDRMDQLDLKLFVTAILIQRQTGGNLTEILENISSVIRERLKIIGQAKALTAEGRLSGWVLCALPIIMFLFIQTLNPEYAGVLINERKGQYLLVIAGILQIVGMLMINKIVNIKV